MKQFINKFFTSTAKKALLIFFVLVFPFMLRSQDTIANRFDFSVAAGVGYNHLWGKDFGGLHDYYYINLEEFPKLIGVFEVSFLFRLKENRHIGLTYSKLNYTNIINNTRYFSYYDVIIHLENYKNYHTYQYFGIEFRQEFIPRLHFGVGLNYYVHHFNYVSLEICDDIPCFTGEDWKQRLDDLALTAFLDYYFPVKNYVQIGLRTKGFLTLSGFEAITLTPVLKFSF